MVRFAVAAGAAGKAGPAAKAAMKKKIQNLDQCIAGHIFTEIAPVIAFVREYGHLPGGRSSGRG